MNEAVETVAEMELTAEQLKVGEVLLGAGFACKMFVYAGGSGEGGDVLQMVLKELAQREWRLHCLPAPLKPYYDRRVQQAMVHDLGL